MRRRLAVALATTALAVSAPSAHGRAAELDSTIEGIVDSFQRSSAGRGARDVSCRLAPMSHQAVCTFTLQTAGGRDEKRVSILVRDGETWSAPFPPRLADQRFLPVWVDGWDTQQHVTVEECLAKRGLVDVSNGRPFCARPLELPSPSTNPPSAQ